MLQGSEPPALLSILAAEIPGLRLAPSMLAELKSDPEKYQEAIGQFQKQKAAELASELNAINWSTATYDDREKKVSFGSSTIKFQRADQSWRLVK